MLSFREKICYGFGVGGYNIGDTIISTYLVLFATDVMGLPPGIVGTILLIPKITDVFSDFVLMNFIDRTKSRFGTYRPWTFSSFAYCICLILIFLAPGFLKTNGQKLVWVTIIYLLAVTIFETVYWCSYSTLRSVITSDEKERTELAGINSIFDTIFGLSTAALFFPMLSYFGNGYRDINSWRITIPIFATIGAISGLVLFLGVKEKVALEKAVDKIPLAEKAKAILSNKQFLYTTGIICIICIGLYFYITLATYYIINNLGHEDWYAYYIAIGSIFDITICYFSPKVSEKLGYKKTVKVGSIFIILSSFVMALWCGQYIFFLFIILKSFGLYITYVCSFGKIPAISENIAKEHKGLLPGTVFGFSSSLQKLSITLGAFLATKVLAFGKYDASLTIQSQFTLDSIQYGIALIFFIIGALMFLLSKKIKD